MSTQYGYRRALDVLFEDVMPRTVLVPDDNPVIRKMLCRMFEREEDYDLCAEATNGQEAISLAIRCSPDLIILDLSMPIMGGIDAAREIKRIMPGVPIILFTQHAELGPSMTNLSVDRIVAKDDFSTLMGHVRSLASAW